jgi:hypothetical protein
MNEKREKRGKKRKKEENEGKWKKKNYFFPTSRKQERKAGKKSREIVTFGQCCGAGVASFGRSRNAMRLRLQQRY